MIYIWYNGMIWNVWNVSFRQMSTNVGFSERASQVVWKAREALLSDRNNVGYLPLFGVIHIQYTDLTFEPLSHEHSTTWMPDRRQPLDCMILHGCLQVCTLIIFNLCLCNCTETIQGIGLVGQCLERSASLLNFDWRTVHCLLGILRCFSLVSPCFSSVHRTLGTPKYHQAMRRSTGPTDLDRRTWKSSASQQPTDIWYLLIFDIWREWISRLATDAKTGDPSRDRNSSRRPVLRRLAAQLQRLDPGLVMSGIPGPVTINQWNIWIIYG